MMFSTTARYFSRCAAICILKEAEGSICSAVANGGDIADDCSMMMTCMGGEDNMADFIHSRPQGVQYAVIYIEEDLNTSKIQ